MRVSRIDIIFFPIVTFQYNKTIYCECAIHEKARNYQNLKNVNQHNFSQIFFYHQRKISCIVTNKFRSGYPVLGILLAHHLGRSPGCLNSLSQCGQILITSLKCTSMELSSPLHLITSQCLFTFLDLPYTVLYQSGVKCKHMVMKRVWQGNTLVMVGVECHPLSWLSH